MLTDQIFSYLTEATKKNYPFLVQMMSWYNNLVAKELIKQHLQTNGKFLEQHVPKNTNFTEHNIWLVLGDSISGFKEDGITVTRLEPFLTISEMISYLPRQADTHNMTNFLQR